MQPVVTVAEMRAADARALRSTSEAALVARAGTAVAAQALEMLGSGYGRRVVVVAGPGNNGADGRVAAALLRRRGARVEVLDAREPGRLGPCDLVIDAAYGTGFRGRYDAPEVPAGAAVLAVDIPSGLDGDTGTAPGRPMVADRTVTFAARKPGLLQGDGPDLAGRVVVAEIGVPVSPASIGLVEDLDVALGLPRRGRESHKWASALAVVAGSPGMEGAAVLAAGGASHAGAGMVRLAVPGSEATGGPSEPGPWPIEAVRLALPEEGWSGRVLEVVERCRALVVGPGLGRAESTQAEVRRLVAEARVPVVVDADGLFALGGAERARPVLAGRAGGHPAVLTPHDGEFARLDGAAAGGDRIAASRRLAERTGAVVLLKGSLSVVASGTEVLLSAAGSSRLATAGTGDVLSGIIGAFLARGLGAEPAAALAAHAHGRAAAQGRAEGLVAGDLPPLVAAWLSATLDPPESGRG